MTEKASLPLFDCWSPQMSVAECEGGDWSGPRVVPTAQVPIHPGAMGIQFGQSVFEGCKAFWDGERSAYLFRLEDHHERLARSCERMCMPVVPHDVFVKAVEDLARMRASWTSPFSSEVLYIRPILYGEDDHVMPLPSLRSSFFVLTAPLRHFPDRRLSLFAERECSRAARGGLGYAKTAANYAHQYLPTTRAKDSGCDAVLWLDAETHSFVEEASTMNIFMVCDGELVTPPLGDTILAGITRRSVIQLAREKHGVTVVERPVSLQEIFEGVEAGTIAELFTTSTALGIRPVGRIVDGERTICPPEGNPLAERLRGDLLGIQRGKKEDPWRWISTVAVAD